MKHTCYQNKISALVSDMLVNLGRQYEFSHLDVHPAFSAINKTRSYMLENVDKKLTLKELSKHALYSESRFSILYNRFFKSSPIEDLLTARIEKAESLLEYSSYSITQIAELCGFSSIHHFSKTFKERTGISPSEYLNRRK